MLLINNPAESAVSHRITLPYLVLFGDVASHFFVAHSGTICCLWVTETVVTFQISNLVKRTLKIQTVIFILFFPGKGPANRVPSLF